MSLVLLILFNILLFAVITFGTTILIEKYYRGRLKWIVVPSLTLASAFLMIKTDFLVRLLSSLTNQGNAKDFGFILFGGILTGIFFSFL